MLGDGQVASSMIKRFFKKAAIGLLVILALVVLLLAALPAILSTAAARRAVLKRVNAQIDGTLAIERWSFGWLHGARVEGLSFADKQARFGVSLKTCSMSSGLLKLLAPVKDFGEIDIDSPHVWCDVARIEAAATPAAKPRPSGKPPPTQTSRMPLALDIVAALALKDAQLEVRKPGQPKAALVLDGSAACRSLKKSIPFSITGDCLVGDAPAPIAGTPPGLKVEGWVLLFNDGVFDPAAIVSEIVLHANQFDLGTLALAKVYVPAMPLVAGRLDSGLTGKIDGVDNLVVSGGVQVAGLQLEGGVLGEDRPNLGNLALDMAVTRVGGNLTVKEFDLRSALATLRAAGRFIPVQGAVYPRGQISAIGDVNLMELAAQFPHTLKLPEDVHLQGGLLNVDGRAGFDATVLRLQGKATLSDVHGTKAGKAFQSSAPIALSASGSISTNGAVLDGLSLQSSFAQASGSGSATGAVITVDSDLAVAAREAEQFVDLGALRLAGRLHSVIQLDLQSPAEPRIDIATEVKELSVAQSPGILQGAQGKQIGGNLVATVGISSPSGTERQITFNANLDTLLLAGLTPKPIQRERVRAVGGGVFGLTSAGVPAGIRTLQIVVEGLPIVLKMQLDFADARAGKPGRVVDAGVQASGTLEEVMAFCEKAGLLENELPLKGPLALDTTVSITADGVELKSFTWNSKPVSLQASGELANAITTQNLQLLGKLGSDCSEIALLTEAFSGFRPDMSGKATRDFMIDAPLGAGTWDAILRGTEAKAALHADHFSQFGVTATAIDLNLGVHAARAQVVMDTVVNEGRLHAEPYLDLAGLQPVLMLPEKSQLLKDVKLNAEMASDLLARVHPIFRGCVVNAGRLGLTMDRLRAPLGDRIRQETTFAGNMDLTSIRLGPGEGLLGQILALTQQLAQDVRVPDQHVLFECRNGRITPSPLTISANGNQLTFSGSVGLDQTVQYVAEVPITEQMVPREVYPYLMGTSIKIPVGGTIDAPRFDKQAFKQALAELAMKAAGNAALEEVKKRAAEEGKKQGSKVWGEILKQIPVGE